MFFLEVSLGQLMSAGGIQAWDILPLFKGVGYAGLFISFCLNIYYNIIIAWILFYLFASFRQILPWSTCHNWWNEKSSNVPEIKSTVTMISKCTNNQTIKAIGEYWENRVLGLSDGIEEVGNIRWELALCLLLAWILVFLCVYRGIKWTGKIMYITATAPYFFMFILLIRTMLLDGAIKGISFYIFPDFTKIFDHKVWSDAGTQIIFSYSIGLGTLTALGSFNKFNHNSVRDCGIFSLMNSFTSLLAGFIIFATLGNMSKITGIEISQIAESGPGLAFIAYPAALSTMYLSPVWSVLFFLMLLFLGLDSQVVGVEGLITGITDLLNQSSRQRNRKIVTFFACIFSYIIGLTMVTNGGIYIFQIMDFCIGSRIVLLIAFFETTAIGYVFGAKRLTKLFEKMYRIRFNCIPTIIYCFVAPACTILLFLMSTVMYGEITFKRSTKSDQYKFPLWSVLIGWLIASCSVLSIPLIAAIKIYRAKGSFSERIKFLCIPQYTQGLIEILNEDQELSIKL